VKFDKGTPWYTRIAMLREKSGKKAHVVCAENNIDRKSWSMWERGLHMPGSKNKERIAGILNATVKEIWG
jgi:transcriptional regulator with XRE-family HTH domain